jgi:DeoR/GlpR family transcriptional regulator of sugar metabolism
MPGKAIAAFGIAASAAGSGLLASGMGLLLADRAAVAGCTEWNVDDAIIKRVALQVSTRCIVAADSTKFGATAFARVCGLGAVSMVVSDASLSDVYREQVALSGVAVHIAA